MSQMLSGPDLEKLLNVSSSKGFKECPICGAKTPELVNECFVCHYKVGKKFRQFKICPYCGAEQKPTFRCKVCNFMEEIVDDVK